MITPNPALDIGGTVDRLIADEKNYVLNETRSAGGNGINAARIAHCLGAKVTALGFLGGPTGSEIEKLLDGQKVTHNFVRTIGNTRINLTISNNETHSQTRLSFPGPEIERTEFRKLQQLCNGINPSSIVLIGGSLPKGIGPQDIELLVEKVKKRGHFFIVDMPGPHLRSIISCRPFLIKPNLSEFQELIGKNVRSIRTVLPFARELSKSISLVCVSSVEGGALLVTKNKAWFGKIPKVKVRSTVGAGDSMVGAMAAALESYKIQKMNKESIDWFLEANGSELLRWGLAASCATLVKQGMVLGDRKSILKYRPMIEIKEINEYKNRKSNGKK
ncbi:MAG: 1-phosphofructokinase family hexose kinase [Parachlamydiales bacterium]|nr:1-phosphofructokinase family hexose kinase [Deltaproteobacteria bacterium]